MPLLITIRVLLSVAASAIQKRMVLDGGRILGIWTTTYILGLPVALVAAAWRWTPPSATFWTDSLLGGGLDALGNLAMLAALKTADLSVFGPLNAIRPILALIFGWIFLDEAPTNAGLLGIVITVGGAAIVLKEDSAKPAGRGKVWTILAWRLLGFGLATVASVFLKRAATTVSAEMTLAGWLASGLICLAVYGAATGESLASKQRGDTWVYLHAAAFILMQWLTIKIFQATLLSYAFVFFQLGMIIQVIVGRFYFKEPQFRRRMAGCLIMCVGALLVLAKG